MAEVRLYIDGQMVLPIIASDMLSMLGWEDSEDTKYFTIPKKGADYEPYDIVLNCDRYIAYMGNEFAAVVISRNRNITIVLNTEYFNIEGAQDYEYFAKTYYVNSRFTELNLPFINLNLTKHDDNWLHLTWEFEGTVFEADISIYL